MTSFWIFLLIPMILASERELKISNYTIKIKENILQSIYATGESSNELDLLNLDLGAVEKSAFNNLSTVKILTLAKNSLKSLPEFVFQNLTNLEHLCLADNKITKFKNVFVGLSSLKSLNISNNPIKFFEQNYFYGLSKSSEILTKGISMFGINAALFENPFLGNQSERSWNIPQYYKEPETTVEKIPIKVCTDDDHVRLVDILKANEFLSSDCQVVNIDRQGEKLSLENLVISTFSKNWYRLQIPSITTLNLARNLITELSANLLNDLPENIKIVDLSNNQITRLKKGVITNGHISILDLGNNIIRHVEEGALEKMNLDELNLRDNSLKDSKFVAFLTPNITNFNLAGNLITDLSIGSFSRFNQLQRLSLFNNKIREVTNQSFAGLLYLDKLDLTGNCIDKIEAGSFQDLKSLRYLLLHNNCITGLEKGIFDGLESLQTLEMGSNKFSKITEEFGLSLPMNLQRLALDVNEIESLEAGSFVNVPKKTLTLNGNKISKIEKGSFDLPDLKGLLLENNFISELNDSFVGLKNLKHLTLEANVITKISKGFAKDLGNVETLNLLKNPINKLESGSLFGLSKLPDNRVVLAEVPVEILQAGLFDDV